MDNSATYQSGDFQRSQDSGIENADQLQLVEPPIAPVSGIPSSDPAKPRQSILPQISSILDSTAQVLFGVSSIKNGQNAQVPSDAFSNNRTVELNQPPKRNNTLLLLGLAAVLVIAFVLIYSKK